MQRLSSMSACLEIREQLVARYRLLENKPTTVANGSRVPKLTEPEQLLVQLPTGFPCGGGG